MSFARVPGWVSAIQMTSTEKSLTFELYRYSSARSYKAWPTVEALVKTLKTSRRTVGRLKMELARKGVLCFCWDKKKRGGHMIWLAVKMPFDFRVETTGPDFKEYRAAKKTKKQSREPRDWSKKKSQPAPKMAQVKLSNPRHGMAQNPRHGMAQVGAQSLKNNAEEIKVIGFQSHAEQTNEQTNTTPSTIRGTASRIEQGGDSNQKTETDAGKSGGSQNVSLDDFETSSMPEKKKPAKKKRKTLSESKAPSGQLLARHCENFKKHTGVLYLPNFAKDLHLAKVLLGVYSLDLMVSANDLFFKEKDPWLDKVGRTFGMFKTKATVLAARAVKNNKRAGRAAIPKSQIKFGTRKLIRNLKSEKVYDEWDGEKWFEVRVKKVKRKFNPPTTDTAEGEFDE